MVDYTLNRRNFVLGASAFVTLSALEAKGLSFEGLPKNIKVGLIGAGWYGKSDLFRLMQVCDVNVVAMSIAKRPYRMPWQHPYLS